jgi:phosphoglycolate phosphatase
MRYRAFLFDFDYTLVDSHVGIVKCYRIVLERHGFMGVSDDAIQRTIGKTLEESFSILSGETDAAVLHGWREEYRKEADKYMTANTFLFPDTSTSLHTLKERGYQLGIISTKYRFRFMDMMNKHFPADFFDVLIGNEDIVRPKPHPEGVILAMQQLHLYPDEVVYVGDSTVDGETAQRAGVAFVGITTGMTTSEALSQYPNIGIFRSLTEMTENSQNLRPNKILEKRTSVGSSANF